MIEIEKVTEEFGFRYQVRNWKEYCEYRKNKGLAIKGRFSVYISFDNKQDFETYYQEFETQLPLLFEISQDDWIVL